jgi:ATP-dependent exoDNAse (exonuclease V) alpha subunit
MAFWNRKRKSDTEVQLQSLVDSGALKELTQAINMSTQATEKSIRSFQEMAKALNNATREFKKGFK